MDKKIFSIKDSSNGRCYELTPTLEMIRSGIRKIEFLFSSPCKIYLHTPGIYSAGRSLTRLLNEAGKKLFYDFIAEFYLMLDDGDEKCNKDPEYNMDNCFHNTFDRMAIKKYGCTTPFGPKKENICSNKTIAAKVSKDFDGWKYHNNCSYPCKTIQIKPLRTHQKNKDETDPNECN